ncbi:MAG: trypsin-like peptidase domain-containing protein [Planctomycetaceae bacterium]|jgi:S1-C subfamily serine protease|nr:trypsin-like peptidase domain-containing protein [Planctomycetaceae bacterium]
MSEPNEYRQNHLPPPPPQPHWQPSATRIPVPENVRQPQRSVRGIPLLLVLIVIVAATWFIPPVIEQTAYSWNRGVERAKADAARQLLSELPQPEQRIVWVAKAVAPSVVGIHSAERVRNNLAMEVGSGVIVDTAGHILTNHHVIANAEHIKVILNDGRSFAATLLGQDRITDIAVLKIDADKLQSVIWGDSTSVEVGDRVVAIGCPYNLQATVTSGIISATERYNPVPGYRGNIARLQEYLQTDAAINPGNSGGALVDVKGELIGINTMIYSETGGNLGIGFAIPSLMAKKVYEEIVRHGKVQHGWLGIEMDPVRNFDKEQMKQEKPQGTVIVGFAPNSPARDAGLEIGDIIVRWGDKQVNDPLHLSHIVVLSSPGTKVPVEIFRKGQKITVEVTIGTRTVNVN